MTPAPLALSSGAYLAAKKDRRVALISLFPEIRMNESATPTQKHGWQTQPHGCDSSFWE